MVYYLNIQTNVGFLQCQEYASVSLKVHRKCFSSHVKMKDTVSFIPIMEKKKKNIVSGSAIVPGSRQDEKTEKTKLSIITLTLQYAH